MSCYYKKNIGHLDLHLKVDLFMSIHELQLTVQQSIVLSQYYNATCVSKDISWIVDSIIQLL